MGKKKSYCFNRTGVSFKRCWTSGEHKKKPQMYKAAAEECVFSPLPETRTNNLQLVTYDIQRDSHPAAGQRRVRYTEHVFVACTFLGGRVRGAECEKRARTGRGRISRARFIPCRRYIPVYYYRYIPIIRGRHILQTDFLSSSSVFGRC